MNQPLDSSFLFSAWAKASADPSSVAEKTSDSDPFFGMAIRLDFSDNTTEIHYKSFDPYCRDWQYVQDIISPDKENNEQGDITITQATIAIAYDNNINTAYVDHVALRLGQAQTYAYDAEGNVDTAKLTGEGTEDAEFDEETGDLTQYTAPNGIVFQYTNNSKHSVTREKVANTVTDYTYDNSGYQKAAKYYADSNTETAYIYTESELTEDKNHVASVTDSAGNTTTVTYVSGLPVTTTNAKNVTSTNTYYPESRRLKSTYITGTAAVNYTYDKGQVTQLQRKTYPYVGAPQEQAVYQTYNYDYNAWGQRTSVSVGNQILSTSEYEDVNSNAPGTGGGNKTKTTYGNGDSISYVYDKLDRLIKTVYNDSGEYVEYTYNGEGALSKLAHHQSNGTVIASYEFERDNLGRLIRSRQVAGNNATVQRTEHIYDAIGRISQQRWSVGSKNYSESYTYNDGETGNGALNTVTTATGDRILFVYDPLNRLDTTTVKQGETTLYTTTYKYMVADSATRLDANQSSNEVQFQYTTLKNGEIFGNQYVYDQLGNITALYESHPVDGYQYRRQLAGYTYDNQGQLTSETYYTYLHNDNGDRDIVTWNYTYDTAGNILSRSKTTKERRDGVVTTTSSVTERTYAYSTGDWKDLLTSVTYGNTTHNLVYDAIGNPLTYGNGQQLYTNLTWEHGRQLASLTTNGNTYTFDYDADGIRTEKNGNGANHEYITQNGKVVREIIRSADWTRVLDFIYDNSGRPFALNYSYDGGNSFETYYYVLNYQGDVVALLDSNCNVVARYTYNAWGEILSVTTDIGAPITDTLDIAHINPLRYRGYYYDSETEFYYVSSRYYDPEIGRFINADDVDLLGANGDFASLNLFAYCGNNPVLREDPNGGCWITAGIMAIGGLIGLAISAVSSAATQEALTGSVNWKSVAVAAASGFVSGAVAASPLGIVGQQIAGGVIGGLSYAADCYVNDKAMKLDEAILSVGMGVISGRIGGPGANEEMVLSNAAKSAKQTIARESRRANQQYAQKVIAATISSRNNTFASTAWVASFRFAVGTGISNGVTGKYSSLELFPNAPTWKPWKFYED